MLKIGYGSYFITQKKGNEGYTLASQYKEKIVDEVSTHKKELYNYYIEVEDELIPEEEIVELPPATKVDNKFGNILMNLLFALGLYFCKVMI